MIKSLLFQAQAMEENLSNLTSASGEASSCSGNRSDQIPSNYSGGNYFSAPPPPPPPKRKRNLPGNPDPDAEVVALSPKTLMATNRFICEICNKGFQRDQNLQLHRRGHNLPWKLKQRANKEVIRKKVYVCPEISCVHHDPLRALGDLTGIKKHFSRKHGEKKWKCDKCSKRYAVQSDWKAHSKTCGTREYRCDCGTLFSRRDSFITHRAFCDALAEESARTITANPILMTNQNPPPLLPTPISSISHLSFQPQTHFNPLDINSFALKKEHQNPQNSTNFIPPWLANHNQDLNPLIINPNHLGHTSLNLPTASSSPSPHMSATALLQKAAQMGATMSSNNNAEAPHTIIRPQHSQDHHVSDSSATTNNATCNFGLNLSSSSSSSRDNQNQVLMGTEAGPGLSPALPLYRNKTLLQPTFLNNATSFSPSAFEGASFEIDEFGGMLKKDEIFNDNPASEEGLSTRDFLGLRAISHTEFLSNIAAAGYGNCISGAAGQTPQTQIQNQPSWQG